MPGGQPVSIRSDLPSGVTNNIAAPPSTSTIVILRSFDAFVTLACAPAFAVANPSRHMATAPAVFRWNIILLTIFHLNTIQKPTRL